MLEAEMRGDVNIALEGDPRRPQAHGPTGKGNSFPFTPEDGFHVFGTSPRSLAISALMPLKPSRVRMARYPTMPRCFSIAGSKTVMMGVGLRGAFAMES